MTFAYLILAHKNPLQLLRQINALATDGTSFFIHIDGKTDDRPFKSAVGACKNVFFCRNRKNVNWGGFSMVEATMELIGEMAAHAGFPDYVHLLSGQDFPIQSNEYIFNYFERNKGRNFISYFSLPCSNWNNGGLDRVKYKWDIDSRGFEKAPKLRNRQELQGCLPDIALYGGSQWWSLTGECVARIFNECRQGNGLYEFYRHASIPDEMLFQTLLMNSEYEKTIINNNLRKIDWTNAITSPKIWQAGDFEKLTASSKLFARKFDENMDHLILEKLETFIKQNSHPGNAPAISVVMPVYNAEKYLPESIESILSQTFGDFELIIVDDGSEDGSAAIIARYSDKRIKSISNPHNFIDSLNTGLSEAKGKYIARMDADDIMMPERLEVQFEYMEAHPDIDMCGAWATYFGTVDTNICLPESPTDIACMFLSGNALIHPTMFIRKQSMDKHSLRYRHEYIYAEDYKLWTDFVMCGCKPANVPKILLRYRCGDYQVTRKHGNEMYFVAERVKREYAEYVVNRLCSLDEEVSEYLENLKRKQQTSPDKMQHVIRAMYRNYLQYHE
jgi:glycosyltransferase involved in cell wall biosynthesis